MAGQADFDLLEVGIEGQMLDVPPLDGKLGAIRLPRKTVSVFLHAGQSIAMQNDASVVPSCRARQKVSFYM